jgi:nicotinate-nucleotide adenylyltransferase|tara:strand:+ start:385 stop:921 length:537 start_codon:yes stop_codon:yes gene_type:complete
MDNKDAIGILGGSFDPPHIGHIAISKISIRKFKLKKLYWVITKKNPFKKKTFFSIRDRITKSKLATNKYKAINVKYIDNIVKSSKTINTVKYFRLKNKGKQIYLIIGSDNLISFHKWYEWNKIIKNCQLVVFSRKGYDKKAKKSVILKFLDKKNIIFVKNKKIDISSTIMRSKHLKKQ